MPDLCLSPAARRDHECAVRAFNGWVSLKADEGLTRQAAVKWIAANRPEIHQNFIHATNVLAGRPRAVAHLTPEHKPATAHSSTVTPVARADDSARVEVDARVSRLMATGMRRHEAHARVMRQGPDLRQRLVTEANIIRRTA